MALWAMGDGRRWGMEERIGNAEFGYYGGGANLRFSGRRHMRYPYYSRAELGVEISSL